MASDWNPYYDYSKDTPIIKNWNITPLPEEKDYLLEGVFSLEKEGDHVLIYTILPYLSVAGCPHVKKLLMDGKEEPLMGDPAFTTAYLRPYSCCNAWRFHGEKGEHTLQFFVHCPKENPQEALQVFLLEDLPPCKEAPFFVREMTFPYKSYQEKTEELREDDLSSWTCGLGCGEPVPGRFGFSKGDGVLDCAMPVLGQVDKMFLCGHPSYKKPFRWSYELLPPGMPLHGSYTPAQKGIDEDEIEVNPLSVKWEAEYGKNRFSCTYSLASPGIIAEASENIIHLSGLEYAGNYQYILLPLAHGKVRIINVRDLPDNLPDMGENFLTLFGSTEFPDLPLLLVFQKKISKVEIQFDPRTKRLRSIAFHNTPLMISGTLCGIRSFESISPDDEKMISFLTEKSRFWSRAFLAYPVRCEEYYKVDKEAGKCHIRSRFFYREIPTEWETKPLYLAPLPPAASLSGFPEAQGEYDFDFPTKYGHLKGSFGRENFYSLPLMPVEHRFALPEKGSPIPELFEEGLEAYEKFVSSFDLKFLFYPYAGAVMEPYAYASPLFFLGKAPLREKMLEMLEKRYKTAFSREKDFYYPAISWGEFMARQPDDDEILLMYKDPKLHHYQLQNWYFRQDPFTGAAYHICYLNLGLFSTGILKTGSQEEVENLRQPLVENDWGAGLTFYYIYLSALATGNFTPIRENMELLKSACSFFVKFMDWACMGTGYSDNAINFVEGANYGVFTSFIHFARIAGDKEAENLGEYVAAKQFALRMGIMRASQHYFYKYYDCEPWYTAKSLREESCPTQQFQNVPNDFVDDRIRVAGIYNMTTEGLYPEYFDGLMQAYPEEAREIFGRFRKAIRNKPLTNEHWSSVQCVASSLIQMAMDEKVTHEELLEEIRFAGEKGLLMKEFRGIHVGSRRLPPRFFECQLLLWSMAKKHPMYLERWMDCRMEEMWYDPEKKIASIRVKEGSGRPQVTCFFKKVPRRVLFEGKELQENFRKGSQTLLLPSSGALEIEF